MVLSAIPSFMSRFRPSESSSLVTQETMRVGKTALEQTAAGQAALEEASTTPKWVVPTVIGVGLIGITTYFLLRK